MAPADFNLLVALDALLAEGSVTGAARRLGLSASAMSRTLARLRSATGDPLLAPAGRGLVPTPRAAALRDQVRALVQDAGTVLRPAVDALVPGALDTTFTLRASQSFMESAAGPLVNAVLAAAPLVRLRFVAKPNKDLRSLREGMADLEIGVVGERAPEVRTRLLFRDKFVGVVRNGHRLLADGHPDAHAFAGCGHVAALLGSTAPEPVDASLARAGLQRNVVIAVPGYPDALRIARETDLVTIVPQSCLRHPGAPDVAAAGLTEFDLPFAAPEILVSAMWHPRLDADPGHRWLRGVVAGFFQAAFSPDRAC